MLGAKFESLRLKWRMILVAAVMVMVKAGNSSQATSSNLVAFLALALLFEVCLPSDCFQ